MEQHEEVSSMQVEVDRALCVYNSHLMPRIRGSAPFTLDDVLDVNKADQLQEVQTGRLTSTHDDPAHRPHRPMRTIRAIFWNLVLGPMGMQRPRLPEVLLLWTSCGDG